MSFDRLRADLKTRVVRTIRSSRPGNRWRLGGDRFAMYWYNAEPNFGDRISPLIVASHAVATPQWVHADFPAKVLGAGSILHSARPGDLILGTGAVDSTPVRLPHRTKVLAVRGPLTAGLVSARSDVALGDPGMLIAEVFGLSRSTSTAGRIGVIPHVHHSEQTIAELRSSSVDEDRLVVIDLTDDPALIMNDIRQCETIISSALHGIIAAESLGIPTLWYEIGKPLRGGDFKFRDYYLGTGREPPSPVSLDRALDATVENGVQPFEPDVAPLRSALKKASELLS